MHKRNIGHLGLRVITVGLGCNNFGWNIDQQASQRVVGTAPDLGINLFDTADRYGTTAGESDVVRGKAPGQRRQDIVLLTRFGVDLDDARLRHSSQR